MEPQPAERVRDRARSLPGGGAAAVEPFLRGFLTERGEGYAHHGRLVGIAQASDGALLVSDDTGGVIYRIAYDGAEGGADRAVLTTPPPAARPATDLPPGYGPGRLALDALEVPTGGALILTSPSFEEGGAIPQIHSEYGERVSPALRWDGAPQGTRAYVLLVEDPDAA